MVRVGYHSIAYGPALKFLLDRHTFNVGRFSTMPASNHLLQFLNVLGHDSASTNSLQVQNFAQFPLPLQEWRCILGRFTICSWVKVSRRTPRTRTRRIV